MLKRILYKQKFYKFYDEDIWGNFSLAKKNTKALEYLYESHLRNPKKRSFIKKTGFFFKRKPFKFLYLHTTEDLEFRSKRRKHHGLDTFKVLRLLLFYGNIKQKTFKSYLKQNSKQKKLLSVGISLLWENRLDILLYRTNLFESIFSIKQLINHKNIMVNGNLVTSKGYQINIGDIITINPYRYKQIFLNFKKNLKENRILTNYPKYLEINYKIGSFMLLKKPQTNEIVYPFGIQSSNIMHPFLK